jgi:hypothetical protein
MSTIGRGSRRARPLTPRAVRMRNACVCHAAERLGLAVPGTEELRALSDDAGLRDAVEWWKAQAPGAAAAPRSRSRSRRRFALKTGLVAAVTLLGLAFSYGQAQ